MTACEKSWTYFSDKASEPSDIRVGIFRATSERLPNSEGLVSQNWLLKVTAALLADGVTLRLDPPDRLKLTGDAAAVETWAPLLRPHKAALLALLTERQEAVAALAAVFYRHHTTCPACRHGTQTGAKLHRPCPEGARLWQRYCQAAGRGGRP